MKKKRKAAQKDDLSCKKKSNRKNVENLFGKILNEGQISKQFNATQTGNSNMEFEKNESINVNKERAAQVDVLSSTKKSNRKNLENRYDKNVYETQISKPLNSIEAENSDIEFDKNESFNVKNERAAQFDVSVSTKISNRKIFGSRFDENVYEAP